jgi:hypothetical protein
MESKGERVVGDSTILGQPVDQFSVFLENRVGALCSVVRLLNDSKVEVLGLSVQDAHDVTIVRLVVSDPETVETLFMERGIPFRKVEMVVVELKEGAHGLGQVLAALLQAEVNVNFSYPLLTQPSGKPLLAIAPEDREVAASVLHSCGIRVMHQGDLSR